MRTLFLISFVALASACQVENSIEDLPLMPGDLVMLALTPFPAELSESSPEVSSYLLSQEALPRWEFIESRAPSSSRSPTDQNASGGFLVDVPESVSEVLIWHVPFQALKDIDLLDHRPIFRIQGDPAPQLEQHIYRCYTSQTTCSESSKGIGPLDGTSCSLDKFGTAYYFKRTDDGWKEAELPQDSITLRDYAFETAAAKNDGNKDCEERSAWDF